MKRVIIIAAMALLGGLVTGVVGAAPAEARSCPSASIGGPAVAQIKVRNRTVPVKSVTFRNGGSLLPPATNRAAGISKRNQPLRAKKGTTIITWHVRYGVGCNGTLNPVLKMPLGATFTVAEVGKPAVTYRITQNITVPKSGLKNRWFRRSGPHRLVLLTCADLAGGVFRKTQVVIAARVKTPPVPVVPAPTDPTVPPVG